MIKLKFGNHKLGDDTAILNMGPASECPSRERDMCDVIKKGYRCYAEKAEIQYPANVPGYRRDQRDYWNSSTSEQIVVDVLKRIKRRRKPTRYLRYNESGDFYDQAAVDKLSRVAKALKGVGIVTYGYSARRDLDFSSAEFLVKGSGHTKGNNGRCTVIGKKDTVPEGYIECPGNCKNCNLCKISVPHNIAFRKH